MRYSSLKKKSSDKLHLEIARGTDRENEVYCKKDGNVIGTPIEKHTLPAYSGEGGGGGGETYSAYSGDGRAYSGDGGPTLPTQGMGGATLPPLGMRGGYSDYSGDGGPTLPTLGMGGGGYSAYSA